MLFLGEITDLRLSLQNVLKHTVEIHGIILDVFASVTMLVNYLCPEGAELSIMMLETAAR